MTRARENALIFITSITWVILLITLTVWITGCSQITHTTFDPQGAIKSQTVHKTFMVNERVGQMYYQKDSDSVHFEMGDVEISPQELAVKAYGWGVKAGKAEGVNND